VEIQEMGMIIASSNLFLRNLPTISTIPLKARPSYKEIFIVLAGKARVPFPDISGTLCTEIEYWFNAINSI